MGYKEDFNFFFTFIGATVGSAMIAVSYLFSPLPCLLLVFGGIIVMIGGVCLGLDNVHLFKHSKVKDKNIKRSVESVEEQLKDYEDILDDYVIDYKDSEYSYDNFTDHETHCYLVLEIACKLRKLIKQYPETAIYCDYLLDAIKLYKDLILHLDQLDDKLSSKARDRLIHQAITLEKQIDSAYKKLYSEMYSTSIKPAEEHLVSSYQKKVDDLINHKNLP